MNIIIDSESSGDHKKVKLPVSKKRIDFDMGYPNIPRKEWGRCCQLNENSHQIAITAQIYTLNN
jgi:hypothetical protein